MHCFVFDSGFYPSLLRVGTNKHRWVKILFARSYQLQFVPPKYGVWYWFWFFNGIWQATLLKRQIVPWLTSAVFTLSEESKKKKNVVFSCYSKFVIINNFQETQKEPKIMGFEMMDSFVGFD